ncbi:uncharacterized protein LOC116033352 [Ipomoea triloba]|uniref:uncharacterized protein LOC116033352 n=1 Tax=Ipomoea triloba TaxID=35885 RepID=UPI00125DF5EF|nr:uncharacterized protein LOC116033352 [Ipomoea triloba]
MVPRKINQNNTPGWLTRSTQHPHIAKNPSSSNCEPDLRSNPKSQKKKLPLQSRTFLSVQRPTATHHPPFPPLRSTTVTSHCLPLAFSRRHPPFPASSRVQPPAPAISGLVSRSAAGARHFRPRLAFSRHRLSSIADAKPHLHRCRFAWVRRPVKSNVDLCNDIREFLSMAGLPQDHVSTTKELTQHGRIEEHTTNPFQLQFFF